MIWCKKIRTLMIPALFGVSVSQINLLFDTAVASFLMTGSISWLYYSDRLLEFPLGLFGIAIATVILPARSVNMWTQKAKDFQVLWIGGCVWLFCLACLLCVV